MPRNEGVGRELALAGTLLWRAVNRASAVRLGVAGARLPVETFQFECCRGVAAAGFNLPSPKLASMASAAATGGVAPRQGGRAGSAGMHMLGCQQNQGGPMLLLGRTEISGGLSGLAAGGGAGGQCRHAHGGLPVARLQGGHVGTGKSTQLAMPVGGVLHPSPHSIMCVFQQVYNA